MNKKRQAREFCFQYLFHLQLPMFKELRAALKDAKREELAQSIQDFKETTNTLMADELNAFANDLIEGSIRHADELENTISKYLKNWSINRLSKTDHTILLMSTYELGHHKDTPVNVIINEAIEISKKFGNLESASFVNGVLDNVAKHEK